MITGKMKLRDKKVERILKAKGLQDAEVFHGPRKIWWTVVLMLLMGIAYVFYPLMLKVGQYFLVFFCLYVVIGLVASGYYFGSIAVTDTELIVVNPNAPFAHYVAFPLDQVRLVVIGSQRSLGKDLLCLIDGNYIEIGTDTDLQLFHCAGLEEHDGYGDEGFTDKTLEDLAFLLKKKGITVQLEFTS